MKQFLRYAGMIVLLVMALSLTACSGQQVAGQSATQAAPTLAPVKSASALMAEGKVLPLDSADLSFSTNGVVGEVLVKQGDTVKAGQALIHLKGNDQLQSAISGAELDVLSAQQALNDLSKNLDLERAQAQLALADANKELDKAQKKSNSNEYKHGSDEQIAAAKANYLLTQKAVDDAQGFYDGVKWNGDENLTVANALSNLAAAKQRRDTALANLNWLMAKPNTLDVAQVDANLTLAQAKVKDAESKLAKVTAGPDSDQVALAQARIKSAQAKLVAAQASLKDLELTSPIAGTIISIDTSVGEYVQPGKAVVQVADVSNWVVETTDLTELNVARIKVGMPAQVKFDALPDLDLIGRVERINLLGENRQGDIVYPVRIKLEKPDARLRWNMTTSVTFLEK